MNYTDEQFEMLKDYEPYFQTAVRSNWARGVPSTMLDSLRRIFETVTGKPYPMRMSCGVCQLNLLKDAGTLYFRDKDERQAAALSVANERPADDKSTVTEAKPAKTPEKAKRTRTKKAAK